MSKNAVFDGFDFAANGLTIHKLDMYSRSPKTLQLEDLADEDGSVLVSSQYGPKPILIEGMLTAASESAMEAAIDNLHQAISGNERVLDIPHAGSTRRFIATVENIAIGRDRGYADMVTFSVAFVVPSGYGSDTTSTQLANQTITAAQENISITVGGSFKAQPDITLTITSVTGGGPSKTIRITNPATTQGINITRTWTAGDVVVMNSRNRTIYINNSRIYSSGAFPVWEKGTQTLAYTDDFSSRSVDLLATYTRRWS